MPKTYAHGDFEHSADCKSAIQQVANPRYEGLPGHSTPALCRAGRPKSLAVLNPCLLGRWSEAFDRQLPRPFSAGTLADAGKAASAIQRAGDPQVTALRHEARQGVSSTTVTGFDKACALGADISLKRDGDRQMDPLGRWR